MIHPAQKVLTNYKKVAAWRELRVSVGALDLLLTDLEEHEKMG
jgi:hypothetical protein